MLSSVARRLVEEARRLLKHHSSARENPGPAATFPTLGVVMGKLYGLTTRQESHRTRPRSCRARYRVETRTYYMYSHLHGTIFTVQIATRRGITIRASASAQSTHYASK